ncbi:MAG: hypothetical protein JXP34_12235 [Planctomycetes bacterium]|nr:hypothetical protein [Planctomycetota bacterium]
MAECAKAVGVCRAASIALAIGAAGCAAERPIVRAGAGLWPGRFSATVKADEGLGEGPRVGSRVRSGRDMGLDPIAWIPEPQLVVAPTASDRVALRYRWLATSSAHTIRRDFVFDNALYPAGERARTEFSLQEGTASYERRLLRIGGEETTGGIWGRIACLRGVQETRIRSPSAGSERRTIQVFAPLLGIAVEIPFASSFTLRAGGDGSHWHWDGVEVETWSLEGRVGWSPLRWLEVWAGARYGDNVWGVRRSDAEKSRVRWTQAGPVIGAAVGF